MSVRSAPASRRTIARETSCHLSLRQPACEVNRRALHRGGALVWASLPGMVVPRAMRTSVSHPHRRTHRGHQSLCCAFTPAWGSTLRGETPAVSAPIARTGIACLPLPCGGGGARFYSAGGGIELRSSGEKLRAMSLTRPALSSVITPASRGVLAPFNATLRKSPSHASRQARMPAARTRRRLPGLRPGRSHPP